MESIPAGHVHCVTVEGREVALCVVRGRVYALTGICSYHPISLEGATLEEEILTCQRYGAQFDVRTGESVFLRSVAPLATLAASVRNGQVFVELPDGR